MMNCMLRVKADLPSVNGSLKEALMKMRSFKDAGCSLSVCVSQKIVMQGEAIKHIKQCWTKKSEPSHT